MRVMKRLLFFLIVLLFPHLFSFAQDSLKHKAFEVDKINVQFNFGFISPHHKYMNYLLSAHVKSLEVEFMRKLYGYKYWHKLYKYPEMGLGYYFADLGNYKYLGFAHALYGKFVMPVRHSRRVFYNLSAGVAYLTECFDPQANYYNKIIGSHINFYFRTGISWQTRISPSMLMAFDLNLAHYSNGNFTEPNAGYNVVSLGTAFMPVLREPAVVNDAVMPGIKKNNFEILAAFGYKSAPENVYYPYPVYTFSTNYVRRFDFRNAINIGADFFYDTSIYYHLLFSGREFKKEYNYSGGVHIGYEPFWGNTSISIQSGVYLYNKANLYGIFYHRAAIKHRIKNLIISLAIKSHFFSADILEWKVGWWF